MEEKKCKKCGTLLKEKEDCCRCDKTICHQCCQCRPNCPCGCKGE